MAARPPVGAVRRAFNSMMDWAMGKQVVGKDTMGNVYYRWYEGRGTDRTERREVQWATEHMFYDPKDIPAQWRMWLRKLREEPPSDSEMAQSAVQQAAYAQRVAAVEEGERLRRLRQRTVGTPDQHAGAQPDMARLLQQMGGAAGQPAPTQPPSAAPPPPQGGAAGGAKGGEDGGKGAGEPSGGGEGFSPGTWRPGA